MKRLQASQGIQWLLEEKYNGRLSAAVKKDIARLQKGEHVDYVIGFVDFLGCRIDLSLRPFIPRPETEYWVEEAIQEIQACRAGYAGTVPAQASGAGTVPALQMLDLFAGSGCIGTALLKHIPQARVDFGEKDKRFISQIRLNAKLNDINPRRYKVIQSDVFSSIKGKYDYIFANPPYIAESRKNRVQAQVLKHEPQDSLFAGKDGLDSIRLFLNHAKDFLVEAGTVYLEFDSFQKRFIERYLKKIGYQSWQFFKDQYGKWRWVKVNCFTFTGGSGEAPVKPYRTAPV